MCIDLSGSVGIDKYTPSWKPNNTPSNYYMGAKLHIEDDSGEVNTIASKL